MATIKKAPGTLGQFNLRMPEDLIEALDREVAEENEAHPGRSYTRSMLIREVLYRHVNERTRGKKKVRR